MVKIPRADEGSICPLHKEDMAKVCHTCPWWTRVIGKHPQSEELMDDWRCAVALLPILLIENAQTQRQTGAAGESFRNEMVSGVVEAVGHAAERAGRIIDASNDHRR